MTTIGLQPISLKDATFQVAEDDYTASVGQVVFVPQVEYDWYRGLSGTAYAPYYTGIRWLCQVTYAQDLTTPGALSTYLIEHAAQTRTVVFAPNAGGTAVRADVLIVPGPIGGVPNQVLTASVTLPLFEEPTLGTVV